MDQLAVYADVVADVCAELAARVADATEAGLDPRAVVLDPGLGFAKDAGHNWELLRHLDRLQALGHPVLVGASRKRFLGLLLADADGEPRPVDERDRATDAVSAIAAYAGAWCVRVHDVRGSRDAVQVAGAWSGA
jgi:dihydropteroate synthase